MLPGQIAMNARFCPTNPSATHDLASTMSPDTLIEFTANVNPVGHVPRLAIAARGLPPAGSGGELFRSVLTELVVHLGSGATKTVGVKNAPSVRPTWRRPPFPLSGCPGGTQDSLHGLNGHSLVARPV